MPFTPVQSLVGAVMMGTAATTLLLLNGTVLGISGFVHRTVSYTRHPNPEYLSLWSLAGLLVGGCALGTYRPALEEAIGARLVDIHATPIDRDQSVILITAGLLVGFGSKLANGCTSGHMLCGVSRLSPRSLVASGTFFSFAIATHYFLGRFSLFDAELVSEPEPEMPNWRWVALLQVPLVLCVCVAGALGDLGAQRLIAFGTSLHFALGLALSGMLRPSKVLGFMNAKEWDPSLGMIVIGGVLPQLFLWTYRLGEHVRQTGTRPRFAPAWAIPTTPGQVTLRLIVGAAVFGVGWGVRGICPGPGVVLLGSGLDRRVVVWLAGVAIGGMLGDLV